MSALKRILSIGAAIVVVLSFHAAHAATMSFASGVTSASIGDTVNVSVRIDTQGQTVNAVQGTIQYPTGILRVAGVDHSNSVFNVWAQEPSVNTSTGEISFLGGSTNSFSGASLYVLNITFTVRGTGLATLSFKNAGVTAGDGTGANILSGSTGLSLTISGRAATVVTSTQAVVTSTQAVVAPPPPLPKQITRPAIPAVKTPAAPVLSVGLYPDQTLWYNTTGNFLVQWQLPADITDVATAINQNPQFDPTVSEGLFDNKTFAAISEGVWYLHVRFKNSAGWGPTTHYRIAIDVTPPFPFVAKVKEGLTTEVPSPTLEFTTKDQPSGIAFYRILADGDVVGSTTDPSFMLPSLSFGSHILVVQAVDYAGNETDSRLSVTIAQPAFLTVAGIQVTEGIFFGTIIVVIIIGILIGWWIGRGQKIQRKNRVVIVGRDVAAAFSMIQKNVDKLLGLYSDGVVGLQATETKFLLEKMKQEIEKMKHYGSEEVEELQ